MAELIVSHQQTKCAACGELIDTSDANLVTGSQTFISHFQLRHPELYATIARLDTQQVAA